MLKMRGCTRSGGYFPDAPVYGGQAEEKQAFQAASPVLTAAILCRDRGKCPSRQAQVSDVTDTDASIIS
ncbi:hypothetical protein EII33_12815 [Bacteroides heparinolyticus]|uniref:Uncharacterized protein n=1 Tax=Prevotella heparinolytica TaxID=28113 RepID=A0A3P1ZXP2_9BACE|nr:hypothetical protein [Bacteroides heparinolyticus]RRD87884.1 hypothetical protein EII33_12815 [Bacteroides heparinolyticus]